MCTYTCTPSGSNDNVTFSLYGGSLSASGSIPTWGGGLVTYLAEAGAGGALFNGTIHEMIGVSATLGTNDIQRVEGYLAWKWGLNGNLPTTHPYYKIKP